MRKTFSLFFFICFPPLTAAGASDPYRLLGVLPGHSSEDMDRAFRRIKLRIHPDRNGGSQEAKERFQELEEAYNNLQDPAFRTQYDSYLRENRKGLKEEPNLYKILGVLSDSSPTELTRAYRETRKRVHPDRHGGDDLLANDRFKEVQKAHESLLDPLFRARHDRILRGDGIALAHTASADKQEQPRGRPSQATVKGRNENYGPEAFDRGSADPYPGDPAEEIALASWYASVFDLAKDLEKNGREEDLEEAIHWYRMLAQNNHIEAIRPFSLQAMERLAPLLEKFNMKEAVYRYRIATAEKDIGDDFKRKAFFRQAQIYHRGFSKDGREIIPKDPERAENLYSRAFHLGVKRQDIAKEYEALEDYEKAEEWLTNPVSFGGPVSFRSHTHRQSSGGGMRPNNELTGNGANSARLLHEGISSVQKKQKFHLQDEVALKIARTLLKNGEDPNAVDHLGQTPLFLAAKNLYSGVVRTLLRAGADPNIPDQNGVFPLHAAISSYIEKREIISQAQDDIKTFDLGADVKLWDVTSQAWNIFFMLADEAGLQAGSGPDQKTALETAVDLNQQDLVFWIASLAPPDYLTHEERGRISIRAIANTQEEVFQLVANPSKFAGETTLFQRREIEEMLSAADISKQRKAVSAFQNKTTPLMPEEQEALGLLARESTLFSLRTASWEILSRQPLTETAQEDLLEFAQEQLRGEKSWEDWEVTGLLYDTISSLRRPSPNIQIQLARLAVSENSLETSLPKAALTTLDRIPVYSKATAETLFEGLSSASLSPKMRKRITNSLADFNFAEGYPMVEMDETKQIFSNKTAQNLQELSLTKKTLARMPEAVLLAGVLGLGAGIFYASYDVYLSAMGSGLMSMFYPITRMMSQENKKALIYKQKKRFELCRNAFE